jgi:aminopeptidase N
MFMEMKYPENAISNRSSEIMAITADSSGSVKVDDTNNVNRIFSGRLTYTKGSHLLYMLRFKLGDDVFFKAIRAYQNDTKVAHGFAKTADLQRNLEAVSGVKLDSFFRQWYEGQGHPRYKVLWSQIGNSTVKIKIYQSTSHSSVAFFEMPVALKFKNAQQEKTVVADVKFNGETFIRDIGFVADSVIIDPEYWLISRDNSSEKMDVLDPVKSNVLVYPNPFQDQFSVMISNFKGSSIALTIFDAAGKRVFTQNYNLYQGREFITIPTNHLASGRYTLSILDESGEPSTISMIKN